MKDVDIDVDVDGWKICHDVTSFKGQLVVEPGRNPRSVLME